LPADLRLSRMMFGRGVANDCGVMGQAGYGVCGLR
jgi:hypothetical protein